MGDRYIVETLEVDGDPFRRRWYVRDTDLGYCTDPTNRYRDARAEAQRLNRSPDGHGRLRPPVRDYTTAQAERDGFVMVTDVAALPADVTPQVGDEAVVYARGGLRLGLISKIGRTTIYVDVATPTSPDLITQGKIGGRWRERGYLKAKETTA